MRLYEINDRIYELLNQELIDPETGEILDVNAFDELKDLEVERDIKIENTGLFIKNLDAEITALKAEEKRLAERRKAKENKYNWTKSFLNDFMVMEGLPKFETAKLKLSFRKSESVGITNEKLLPEKFVKTEIISNPMKAEIKKALKSGDDIPGAELVENQNLQVK